MYKILPSMLVSVMMFAVTPAYADIAVQMWKCETDDDATEEQVLEGAKKWLAAAKTMKGGANLRGAAKLEAIVAHSRDALGCAGRFEYIGDSAPDLPILRAAGF